LRCCLPFWTISPSHSENAQVDLTKEIVEFVVRTYPNPDNRIAVAFANGAVLFVDANRPDVIVPSELLESERRMIGILREECVSAPRGHTMGFA